MRTGRAGPHLFTSSDEESEEDAPEGRRAHVGVPWLAPVHATVERNLVWGGYIDSSSRGKAMPKEGVDKIECEVNNFHSEWMNSPPPTMLPPILGPSVSEVPYRGRSRPGIPLHPRK